MLKRSRPEGCLSDFALDSRLAGELEAADAAAAQKHIAECTRCEGRAAALAREREAFAKDAPPLRLPAAPKQPRRLFGGGVVSALALAAAILLFLTFRGREGDGVRMKGETAKLAFYVNHGGSVRLGGPDESVRPGDGLRFVVTTRAERYVAVLSVDGMRHASVYYPSENGAARVATGDGIALPQSTTLDDTLGSETIYGVFCPEPFEIEPLRRKLEANPVEPPAMTGCTVDTLHIRKEAAAAP